MEHAFCLALFGLFLFLQVLARFHHYLALRRRYVPLEDWLRYLRQEYRE